MTRDFDGEVSHLLFIINHNQENEKEPGKGSRALGGDGNSTILTVMEIAFDVT